MESTVPGGRSSPLLKLTLYRLLFVGLTVGLGSCRRLKKPSYYNQYLRLGDRDCAHSHVSLTHTVLSKHEAKPTVICRWFILGGVSRRTSASTTYAWFFEFNYKPCILGSLHLLSESILLTGKVFPSTCTPMQCSKNSRQ